MKGKRNEDSLQTGLLDVAAPVKSILTIKCRKQIFGVMLNFSVNVTIRVGLYLRFYQNLKL